MKCRLGWCLVIACVEIGGLLGYMVASEPSGRASPPIGTLRCESEAWHDADTPKRVKIHLPFGVILDEPNGLRASDCDAWEVGARPGQDVTNEERAKGKAALADLVRTFDEHEFFLEIEGYGRRDKYGRPLGAIWLKRISTGRWERHGETIRSSLTLPASYGESEPRRSVEVGAASIATQLSQNFSTHYKRSTFRTLEDCGNS